MLIKRAGPGLYNIYSYVRLRLVLVQVIGVLDETYSSASMTKYLTFQSLIEKRN